MQASGSSFLAPEIRVWTLTVREAKGHDTQHAVSQRQDMRSGGKLTQAAWGKRNTRKQQRLAKRICGQMFQRPTSGWRVIGYCRLPPANLERGKAAQSVVDGEAKLITCEERAAASHLVRLVIASA